MILAAEFAKYLDDASLDLQFSFTSHQGRKWHATEVPTHGDLHVFHSLCHGIYLIKLLSETHQFNFIEFVRVSEVELWMKVFADRPK